MVWNNTLQKWSARRVVRGIDGTWVWYKLNVPRINWSLENARESVLCKDLTDHLEKISDECHEGKNYEKERWSWGGEVKQGPHCTLKDLTDLFAHVWVRNTLKGLAASRLCGSELFGQQQWANREWLQSFDNLYLRLKIPNQKLIITFISLKQFTLFSLLVDKQYTSHGFWSRFYLL